MFSPQLAWVFARFEPSDTTLLFATEVLSVPFREDDFHSPIIVKVCSLNDGAHITFRKLETLPFLSDIA